MIRSNSHLHHDVAAPTQALATAMREVIDRARQFDTPILVWKDDRMVRLTAEEATRELEIQLSIAGVTAVGR